MYLSVRVENVTGTIRVGYMRNDGDRGQYDVTYVSPEEAQELQRRLEGALEEVAVKVLTEAMERV
jgi:hypothetical protein